MGGFSLTSINIESNILCPAALSVSLPYRTAHGLLLVPFQPGQRGMRAIESLRLRQSLLPAGWGLR